MSNKKIVYILLGLTITSTFSAVMTQVDIITIILLAGAFIVFGIYLFSTGIRIKKID